MSTALDLLSRSVKSFNGLALGETMDGTEAQENLLALNSMLAVWQAESLNIYGELITPYNLVNGTQTYTLGVGGVFNATRPQKITQAKLIDNSASPAVRYPIEIINYQQWADIGLQSQPNPAIPSKLYPDMAFPLMTLYLWGVPGASQQLELYTWQQLQNFATLDIVFSMPPEYEEAIIYNLALRLAPAYQLPISEDTRQLAISSKATLQRLNAVTQVMVCDPAVTAEPSSIWNAGNIYSGG